MIPENTWSCRPVRRRWLAPEQGAVSLLEDRERGGAGLQDPSQGLQVRDWKAWREDLEDAIMVGPVDESFPAIVGYPDAFGATWISLAFDQNMRYILAWQMPGGQVFLYWYDSAIEDYALTSWFGRTPRLTLDDKRPEASGWSDVILFYIEGTTLKMRVQRDRFTIAYNMGEVGLNARLGRVGMAENLRLQVEVFGAPHPADTCPSEEEP